ncbi:MAG TPA: GntG family PLP-dependent aldolase [Cyclobacteriaceae bacterium]|nr:GntG family PLP-dependent aldolase [Cyclobacteriaceae bacterium]
MLIDLRSDTVTRPTPGMLEAMMNAEVGDDVFNEDPTVNALQSKAAGLFGLEDAIFCPSGTMTNQIAVRIQTSPQDEIICDWRSHVYNYEGGGMASNSMVSVKLIDGERGIISPGQILDNIRPDDIHSPVTRLICLESTVNKGGGSYYSLDQFKSIHEVALQNRLGIHLDGARIFNALVETGDSPGELGKYFTTISVCLSKGLGAPVGSLLIGSKELIKKARRARKVFGGAMRQAGYLAAAGLYALENHIGRLKEDHRRARELGKALEACSFVDEVLPVDTNIVIFRLTGDALASGMVKKLSVKGIQAVEFGKQEVRFVTHLDFTDDLLDQSIRILKSVI